MQVARLYAAGDVRLSTEPVPVPQPDETLVRVTAVGLCGSDLHWFAEGAIGDARLAHPLVLGHEFAGITETGQRVAVDPAIPCERCDLCAAGKPNLCRNVRFAGHGAEDGGLREWISWRTRCLMPVPETLTPTDAAMLEPLGIAIHAVDLGKLQVGMTVGVFGCGPIGLLVMQVARAAGAAQILVTEPLAHRLDAARRTGAQLWDGSSEVDVAFECAGTDAAVADAIDAVVPGGRVILVGIPEDDRTTFSASTARRKGLTLKLSRRMMHTYPRAIQLVESGRVDVRSLVTHCFPLSRIGEAFAAAHRREGLKVIVQPA